MYPVLLVLAACAAPTGGGPGLAEAVAELDAKADTTLTVDIGRLQAFELRCPLESCRYRLALEGAPEGATLTAITGEFEDIERARYLVDAQNGDLSGDELSAYVDRWTSQLGLRRTTVQAEGPDAVLFVEPEFSWAHGFVFVHGLEAEAWPVEATVRVVPQLDAATELPLVADGHYGISSVIDGDDVHRWTVPITDVVSFFDPSVDLRVTSYDGYTRTAVYYQCDYDGSTDRIEVEALDQLGSRYTFAPSCPTFDDGGAIYIEVVGAPSAAAVYALDVRLD